MEREIKFKFWLGHTKKMTYEHSLIDIAHLHWDFTEDIIPLQYTGLKDKNGVEIYEGDIINYCFDGVSFIDNGTYVFFDKCYFGVKRYNFCPVLSDCENIEIIGNIYYNPELLTNHEKTQPH